MVRPLELLSRGVKESPKIISTIAIALLASQRLKVGPYCFKHYSTSDTIKLDLT